MAQIIVGKTLPGMGRVKGKTAKGRERPRFFAAAQPSARASLVLVVPALSHGFEYVQPQTSGMQMIVI
jgi:hypothetical protein